jgi:hypothetical protein
MSESNAVIIIIFVLRCSIDLYVPS